MTAANELHSEDRRANPRAPIQTSVDYFSDGELQVGETIDLGGGGMLLALEHPLEVGSEVRLRFTPPEADRSIFMGGRVARLAGQGAVGIEFLEPVEESVTLLDRLAEEFVQGLRALEPPAPAPEAPEAVAEVEPLYFTLTFATTGEFLEAYVEHLSMLRVLVANPEPLEIGCPVVIELELPNYYEPIALAGEVADISLAGEWAQEDLTVVQLTEPESKSMAFLKQFASVYMGEDSTAPADEETEEVEVFVEADDDFAGGHEIELSADDFGGTGEKIGLAEEADPLDSAIAFALSDDPAAGESTWSEQQAETERAVEAAMKASTRPAGRPAKSAARAATDGRYFGDALVADLLADEELSGEGADFGAAQSAEATPEPGEAPRASTRVRSPRTLEPEEVERLRLDLESADPEARRAAVWALGEATNPPDDILPGLLEALDDSDSRVRWRAARALGGMGEAARGAAEALEGHREDPDPGVRFMVAETLSSLAG